MCHFANACPQMCPTHHLSLASVRYHHYCAYTSQSLDKDDDDDDDVEDDNLLCETFLSNINC
jgi:hypothetical protein